MHRVSEYLGASISTTFRMILLEKERALGFDVPRGGRFKVSGPDFDLKAKAKPAPKRRHGLERK
jgi:hypothetical protein